VILGHGVHKKIIVIRKLARVFPDALLLTNVSTVNQFLDVFVIPILADAKVPTHLFNTWKGCITLTSKAAKISIYGFGLYMEFRVLHNHLGNNAIAICKYRTLGVLEKILFH